MKNSTSDYEATLLIVDDQPANLSMLVTILEEHGFEIMVARDGKKGLVLAEYTRPDLILLDAIMPGMDGFETCRQLKTAASTREIPVIFMTALTKINDKVKGFEAGAVDYVTKPIQADELLARISTHLHLQELQTKLQQQNNLLEEKNAALIREIDERQRAEANLQTAHDDLKTSLADLQRTQAQLIESEKLAALGKLVANIAHEINTPIGAIRSSIGNMSYALEQVLNQLPTFFLSLSTEERQEFFSLLDKALQKTTSRSIREENAHQRDLLVTLEQQGLEYTSHLAEMLVSIGIDDNIQAIFPLLHNPKHPDIINMVYHLSGLQESTQTIKMAIQRVSKIVFALKTYAHPGNPSRKMVEADILQSIETTLTIFQSQLQARVKVVRHYADVPPILCYPYELQQVWMNLIQNALQAMNYQGTLEITVGSRQKTEDTTHHPPPSAQYIVVSITDSGCGISEEIKDKLFDPFFTTRPTGEGSGLGLNIVKKIVEKHHGHIEIHSQPGKTTFQIFLPHVLMQPLPNSHVK